MLSRLLDIVVVGLVPIAVLTLIVSAVTVNLVAWQPPILQTTQFGTDNSWNGITGMAPDSAGFYATGFSGYANVTPSYFFVSKYDSNAHQLWTQHYDNATFQSKMPDVGVGAEGVYVVGALPASTNAGYVRKYDLSGNPVWNVQFGIGATIASAVSVSKANVYVAGQSLSRPALGNFLRSYDPNGTLVWSLELGNNDAGIVVYAGLGGVYVSYRGSQFTSLVQAYDPNGTLLWTQTCSCEPTGITGDSSGIYLVGLSYFSSPGYAYGFISKYGFNGNQLWNATYKISNEIVTVGVATDSSGVYLASTVSNGRGVVMKYDINGDLQWSVLLPLTSGNGMLFNGAVVGDVLAVGGEQVYVGGSSLGSSGNNPAFITLVGKTASLIFFGVQPPLSFGLLGLLIAAAALSIPLVRRRWKRKSRPARTDMGYPPQTVSTDIYRPASR